MLSTQQIIPTVLPSAYAAGVLTSTQTNPANNDTVTIGSIVYTYKTTPANPYEIAIGSDSDESLQNLADAINGDLAGTDAHPLVTSGDVTSDTITITAINIGYAGNSIATTDDGDQLSWGADTMVGGVGGSLNGININGDSDGAVVVTDPIDVSAFDELIAFLNVTDHAGTNPTLDVKAQLSPDAITWMDAGDAFAQVTETDAMIMKKLTANFGKFVRFHITTGGTSPEYTVALHLIGKGN